MLPERRNFLTLLLAPFAAALSLPLLRRIRHRGDFGPRHRYNLQEKNALFAQHYGRTGSHPDWPRCESIFPLGTKTEDYWTVKKKWETNLDTAEDRYLFSGGNRQHVPPLTAKEKLDSLLRKELKAAADDLDATEDNDPIYGKFTMIRKA